MKQITTVFFLLLSTLLFSQTEWNTDDHGYALNGYDAVAYVRKGVAMEGLEEYTYEYDGVKFKFSRPAYLNEFKQNPEQYLPAYKGWCAYAIAKDGSFVDVNPKTFKVQDGKLLMFYDKFGINTLKKWEKDSEQMIQKAEEQWNQIDKD